MLKPLFTIAISFLISFQALASEPQTPLEKSGWKTLTTHKQMIDYLKPLVASSSLVEMKSIGNSVAGKNIPALFFSQDDIFASQREKKPMVLVICQQHGNEPSSKEAAMIVTRHLLNEGSNLLQNLDLILVQIEWRNTINY